MPRSATPLITLLAALAAAPAAAGAAVRAPGATGPLQTERLSDERTVSRWAYAEYAQSIRNAPRRGARTVAHLRFLSEDLVREVYLVLASRRSHGGVWLQVRVPKRPNGTTGWVPRRALGALHVVRTQLQIDRRALRATLLRRGGPVWSSRIGIGKRGTPTPAGRFYIRARLHNLRGNPVYGPWAFATSAYSPLSDWPGGGVVGIHGTDQPGLLPGRVSHGCIRVPNDRVRRLARLLPVGTPVRVR